VDDSNALERRTDDIPAEAGIPAFFEAFSAMGVVLGVIAFMGGQLSPPAAFLLMLVLWVPATFVVYRLRVHSARKKRVIDQAEMDRMFSEKLQLLEARFNERQEDMQRMVGQYHAEIRAELIRIARADDQKEALRLALQDPQSSIRALIADIQDDEEGEKDDVQAKS
jgi:hypothetical protein